MFVVVYRYRDCLYEPEPQWDGEHWMPAAVISRGQHQKRFASESTFDTRVQALAESIQLAMRVIDRIMSGAEELS